MVTGSPVSSSDAVHELLLKDYAKKHYRSWTPFARKRGHDVELKDIILVTGIDMAEEYAMASFSGNSSTLDIRFKVGYDAAVSTAISLWGSWEASPIVHHNCGPLRPRVHTDATHSFPRSSSSTMDTSTTLDAGTRAEDYRFSLFVRGCRIRERAKFFPTVIKAGAGYHRLPDPDLEDEDENDGVVVVSDTQPVIITISLVDQLHAHVVHSLLIPWSQFSNTFSRCVKLSSSH